MGKTIGNKSACMNTVLGLAQEIAITSEILDAVSKLRTRAAQHAEMESLILMLEMNLKEFKKGSKQNCGIDTTDEGEWGRVALLVEQGINDMKVGDIDGALKSLDKALYDTVRV